MPGACLATGAAMVAAHLITTYVPLDFAKAFSHTTQTLVAAGVWYLALAVVLSLSADATVPLVGERNLLQQLDFVTAGVLLPLVALLVAVLVGWFLHPEILRLELARESDLFFSLWRGLLRYIAPPAIAILMVQTYLAGGW